MNKLFASGLIYAGIILGFLFVGFGCLIDNFLIRGLLIIPGVVLVMTLIKNKKQFIECITRRENI